MPVTLMRNDAPLPPEEPSREILPGDAPDVVFEDPKKPKIVGKKRSEYYLDAAKKVRSGLLLPNISSEDREEMVAIYEKAADKYRRRGE